MTKIVIIMGADTSGISILVAFLIHTVTSKEVVTCIPTRGYRAQSCHSFSLSCAPGSYIRFDTLQYHWSDCINTFNCPGPGQCCNTIRNINYYCHSDFSMVDTYQAYEICSGRESCTGTASSVITGAQEPTECAGRGQNQPLSAAPLSVSFEYDCVEASAMINLCEGISKTVTSTGQAIHFMYNRGSLNPLTKQPIQCVCRVEFNKPGAPNTPPTLAYQDIRLHRDLSNVRDTSSKCSSVHLSVSTSSKLEDRHCTSLDPISSFYVRAPEPVDDDLNIKLDSLFNDGADDEPEMIWLSLKASSPVTVTCGSQIVPQKQTNKDNKAVEDEDDSDIFTIVIPVICVTIAVACLITVFVVLRKRKTKTAHSLQPRSARPTVRTIGDYDIYETIDDLSRHGSRYSKTGGYSQGYTDAYSSVSVDNFVPRQKHKPDYDKTTTEGDYNRITLRTSHEIMHDPDYSRLNCDTDSGVVDTFAILHTNSSEENETDDVDNTINSRGRTTNSVSVYERSRDRVNTAGETGPVKPALKRKDSYEIPVTETKLDETENSEYSKPVKFKREENKQNDAVVGGDETSHDETSQDHENYRETTESETSPGVRYNIDDGYEEVVPVSVTGNRSSMKDDLNTQNVTVAIPLPKRNGDNTGSDSD